MELLIEQDKNHQLEPMVTKFATVKNREKVNTH